MSDWLAHYGRKGMKWHKHIFGKDASAKDRFAGGEHGEDNVRRLVQEGQSSNFSNKDPYLNTSRVLGSRTRHGVNEWTLVGRDYGRSSKAYDNGVGYASYVTKRYASEAKKQAAQNITKKYSSRTVSSLSNAVSDMKKSRTIVGKLRNFKASSEIKNPKRMNNYLNRDKTKDNPQRKVRTGYDYDSNGRRRY